MVFKIKKTYVHIGNLLTFLLFSHYEMNDIQDWSNLSVCVRKLLRSEMESAVVANKID